MMCISHFGAISVEGSVGSYSSSLAIALTLSKHQILDSSKLKQLQTTISNLMKMEESYPNGKKTLFSVLERLVL